MISRHLYSPEKFVCPSNFEIKHFLAYFSRIYNFDLWIFVSVVMKFYRVSHFFRVK